MADETGRVRIRCDMLVKIVGDLDNDQELQEIFGRPVSEALIVVAEGDDLRIEDGGSVELTGEESKRFLEILNGIIKDNST